MREAVNGSTTPAASTSRDHVAAGTQSIGRSLALLRLVAAAGPQGVRVSEIAVECRLHVATAHRLLAALAREGFVAQDPATRRYGPGPELLTMAFQTQHRYALESRVVPMLERLAAATGDVVYATVRAGDEAVCLARREGSFPIRALPIGPGTCRPLGIGAGSLAILAFLPAEEAAEIMARNAVRYRQYGQTADNVAGFVRRTRASGFALNDGRIIPGMSAVALPIPPAPSRPVAAISVAAIESRMPEERQQVIARLLAEEANGFARVPVET